MNTRSLYFFATKDEVAEVLGEVLAENDLHAFVWYWPPHSGKLTSSADIRDDLRPENACRLYIREEPLEPLRLHEYERMPDGFVLVDVARLERGALVESAILAKTVSYSPELEMELPRPDVKALFKTVSKPFRRILKRPVYSVDGRKARYLSFTTGAREWFQQGGRLIDMGRNEYTLDDPASGG